MDVVWLKRDVRLHDHAPLSMAFESGRPVLLLYVYEPSQLRHPTVHGSHVHFTNEGLIELDTQLRALTGDSSRHCVTMREGEVVDVLADLHAWRGVARLLAHQETGTYASFERDIGVRRWCRARKIAFREPACNGVTRGLRNRNRFTANYNRYITAPEATMPARAALCKRLVRDAHSVGIRTPCQLPVSREHVADRAERQRGGERAALEVLQAFLAHRGEHFARHISSPAAAWQSCSRLSPYLAHGHLSVKRLTRALSERRDERTSGGLARSLAAFHSRVRWRSHFIQKLESQPDIEFRAMCAPLNSVRTAPDDWDDSKYRAWCTGRTGFPMVDACMRCLVRHGWVNFRMRAMLVSFATYNLWLDWRGISSHLARVFLDYEPGIHYPQVQMQAGVTGINAMRVYSVTKQGKDQDKDGSFIRRYVRELSAVPTQFIHEPWKMPKVLQDSIGVLIGDELEDEANMKSYLTYPAPIVNEATSARKAKEKMNALRKENGTRKAAAVVLERHGSRVNREKRVHVPDPNQKTLPSLLSTQNKEKTSSLIVSSGVEEKGSATKKNERPNNGQAKIAFSQKRPRAPGASSTVSPAESQSTPASMPSKASMGGMKRSTVSSSKRKLDNSLTEKPNENAGNACVPSQKQRRITSMLLRNSSKAWSCHACTYLNEKVHASVCELCRSPRASDSSVVQP